jgi:hypothetical protein
MLPVALLLLNIPTAGGAVPVGVVPVLLLKKFAEPVAGGLLAVLLLKKPVAAGLPAPILPNMLFPAPVPGAGLGLSMLFPVGLLRVFSVPAALLKKLLGWFEAAPVAMKAFPIALASPVLVWFLVNGFGAPGAFPNALPF